MKIHRRTLLASLLSITVALPAHASPPRPRSPATSAEPLDPTAAVVSPRPATPIAYTHFVYRQRGGVQSTVHVVRIDTTDPDVELRVSAPRERHQTVRAWARHVGAAVAINGDFFLPGAIPVGPARGAGVDWPARPGQYFGAILAQRAGAAPEVLDHIPDARYANFVSSMDRIVSHGVAVVDPRVWYAPGRHPRTAIAFDSDRHTMMFVVVDGRTPASAGMTMPELRELLISLGAVEALNMDGGGSSTLYLERRGVMNHTGGGPRRVANHVGIVLRSVR